MLATLKRKTAKLRQELRKHHPQVSHPSPVDSRRECARLDPAFFINEFCQIKDDRRWLPFRLWPAQVTALEQIRGHKQSVVLKARQLGLTAVCLGYALWLLLFQPGSTILLFSKTDPDAKELLSRLQKMYARLPGWLRPMAPRHSSKTPTDNKHEWELPNGSRVLSFATTGGRSYTATLAVVDEADHVPNLADLLNAVEPTVDAGGQLVLVSTADKSKPESPFKKIYRAAKSEGGDFHPIFLPWSARPDRTVEWYEAKQRASIEKTGSLDNVQQEYPATDVDALAPRSLDKRIPPDWLTACFVELVPYGRYGPRRYPPAYHPLPPEIPGLTIFQLPEKGHTYACGADPAEGNPTSDESSATWLDVATGEEVASLHGRYQPDVFAGYVAQVSAFFQGAPVLVERNNHGHAVLLWLRDNASRLSRLGGLDGNPGWQETTKSKSILYDKATEAVGARQLVIHDFGTLTQLQSIDGSSLKAPQGQHDDRAVGYVLAIAAVEKTAGTAGPRPLPYTKEPGRALPRAW